MCSQGSLKVHDAFAVAVNVIHNLRSAMACHGVQSSNVEIRPVTFKG